MSNCCSCIFLIFNQLPSRIFFFSKEREHLTIATCFAKMVGFHIIKSIKTFFDLRWIQRFQYTKHQILHDKRTKLLLTRYSDQHSLARLPFIQTEMGTEMKWDKFHS
mgnify:CR=1 FL=1